MSVLAVAGVASGGLGASGDSAAATVARDRAVTDMPDEISGPQVHVLYAVASDGGDRQLDTNGVVSTCVASWQKWLRGQTDGRGVRLDTHQGELDISFLRLAGAFVGPTLPLRRQFGRRASIDPAKFYAVFWDGGAGWGWVRCCVGHRPRSRILILRGTPPRVAVRSRPHSEETRPGTSSSGCSTGDRPRARICAELRPALARCPGWVHTCRTAGSISCSRATRAMGCRRKI